MPQIYKKNRVMISTPRLKAEDAPKQNTNNPGIDETESSGGYWSFAAGDAALQVVVVDGGVGLLDAAVEFAEAE